MPIVMSFACCAQDVSQTTATKAAAAVQQDQSYVQLQQTRFEPIIESGNNFSKISIIYSFLKTSITIILCDCNYAYYYTMYM